MMDNLHITNYYAITFNSMGLQLMLKQRSLELCHIMIWQERWSTVYIADHIVPADSLLGQIK